MANKGPKNWKEFLQAYQNYSTGGTFEPMSYRELGDQTAGYLTSLYENDPRARGFGFDTRTFIPSDPKSAISQGETFGVNELNQGRRFTAMQESLSRTSDQADLAQRLAEARKDTQAFLDTQEGRFERETRGMGLSARQQKAAKQRMSLNRAVSEVSAMSGVRRSSAASAREANRLGSIMGDMSLGQSAAVYQSMANAEGQKEIREAQEKAAERGAKNSMIGQGIGAIIAIAASSEGWKDKVEENPNLLGKLKKLRVDKWKYKGDRQDHVGPYAEEFNETFGTEGAAGDKRFINLIDAVGVALGAVKQLDQKVEALQNG